MTCEQALGALLAPNADAHPAKPPRRRDGWFVYPYGWWTELAGAYVIFDRFYRPIARLSSGQVEIVQSDVGIDFIDQRWFYSSGNSPFINAETRGRILGVVDRLGIMEEVERRIGLARRGLLPCSDRRWRVQ
jgi:hypothetical protein